MSEAEDTQSDDILEQEFSDVEIEKEDEQPKDTIKRLRERLKETVKKKQEYLNGWQRSKADLINTKKQHKQEKVDAKDRAVESTITDILPALDSFEAAMSSPQWNDIGDEWRVGVEQIKKQLEQALAENDVEEILPQAGDVFDPKLHNSVDTETDETKEDDTIASVEKRGFKRNDRIIRSANVVVYTHKK